MPSPDGLALLTFSLGKLYRKHRRCIPFKVLHAYHDLLCQLRPYVLPDMSKPVSTSLQSARQDVRDIMDHLLELAKPPCDSGQIHDVMAIEKKDSSLQQTDKDMTPSGGVIDAQASTVQDHGGAPCSSVPLHDSDCPAPVPEAPACILTTSCSSGTRTFPVAPYLKIVSRDADSDCRHAAARTGANLQGVQDLTELPTSRTPDVLAMPNAKRPKTVSFALVDDAEAPPRRRQRYSTYPKKGQTEGFGICSGTLPWQFWLFMSFFVLARCSLLGTRLRENLLGCSALAVWIWQCSLVGFGLWKFVFPSRTGSMALTGSRLRSRFFWMQLSGCMVMALQRDGCAVTAGCACMLRPCNLVLAVLLCIRTVVPVWFDQ